jgi:GntR family transcriptional regulator
MAGAELSKTRRVYLALRDGIAKGNFRHAGGLPGEQALASEFNVSRVTLRRALATLEEEGLIDRRRGAGTFLKRGGAPDPIVIEFADVTTQLKAMGHSTDVRLLEFAYQAAPPDVSEALRLRPDAIAQRSVRVRLIENAPFSYLVTWIPEDIGRRYSRDELATRPLLELLERYGVVTDHATQDISAELAAPDVAAALDVNVGSALIALRRAVYDAEGHGVEYLRALYRPDRYAFRMEMARKGESAARRWEQAPRPQSLQGASA